MSEGETANLLCLVCGEPSYFEEGIFPDQCPNCGDTGTPADLDETLNLTITAHELRVLTFWAEGYIKLLDRTALMSSESVARAHKVLKTVFERLGMQTTVPLTMSQDIADFRSYLSEQTEGASNRMVIIDLNGKCVDCGMKVDLARFYEHKCAPPEGMGGLDIPIE